MIRRPPRSTLFPSTLFRSPKLRWRRAGRLSPSHGRRPAKCRANSARGGRRSEEHTSELQSLRHLVCRLLLEKKKKKKTNKCTRQKTQNDINLTVPKSENVH